ncbi:hypothetical protein CPC08DRAFT_713722 [Agrocybe pediades]|nr:hypothetical protein CPC08DRAFT_713722 [Agrocybe pediades]
MPLAHVTEPRVAVDCPVWRPARRQRSLSGRHFRASYIRRHFFRIFFGWLLLSIQSADVFSLRLDTEYSVSSAIAWTSSRSSLSS